MGIKTEAENYIPISLLPLISKVIEKSIHDEKTGFPSKKWIAVLIPIRL